jgi:hypothetical protein
LPHFFGDKNTIKTPFEIKKNLKFKDKESKDENLSNDQLKQKINENKKTEKKRIITSNKSSLNFQLVSGVSKDNLVKLSRNLSKIVVKPLNNYYSNKKYENN